MSIIYHTPTPRVCYRRKQNIQLLSKNFIDSDFCHNYLHTLYVFACLL